jgi:dipeptidyl aminopeptidase/acylaminoacyl peptidase
MKKLLPALVFLISFQLWAQENITYQRPPEEIAKLVEAPLTPFVTFSPDKVWMLLLERSDFPSIEELSRPELRIAGLRINPDNFGPSRANYTIGLKVKKINGGTEVTINGLPSPLLASSINFSPNSKKIAFLQNNPNGIELWVIDLATLTASKVTDRKINNVIGGGYTWLSNSNQLLFAAVPSNLKMPTKSRVPEGPVVEENLGKKAPSRTYQDLLKNPYDEALFDYYTTTDLVLKNLDGSEKVISVSANHKDFTPSPDGKLILSETIHKPYSYLVPVYRFPYLVKVIDLDGKEIKKVVDVPLTDYIPNGFNAVQREPRSHNWRSDKPATLYWTQAQDGGDPKAKAEIRDKIFTWEYPFTSEPKELIKLPLRYAGMQWGNDGVALAYERWTSDRKERVYQVNPSAGTSKLLFDLNYEDAYSDPGNVMTTLNQYGRSVIYVSKDNAVYLAGNGSSPEGDMPFLDKLTLTNGKKTRLWRCTAPYYERVVTMLDPTKATFVTSRESNTENPNYFIRTATSKKITQLTNFEHPYPQIKDVKKEVLKYKRADGVELTATLYLPVGYKKEDGPLPGFVWAYPREFKSADAAGQVKGSPYTFTRISWGSPIYWVTRGYAILDNAAIPIVGEGDKEPNDTYIEQLVSSAKAVVDYAASLGVLDPERVGVGGHSYGAFMTANLLAHSNIFKAGIARSGAYNRTLTPFGFQAEERTYWEAPDVYFNMSPFSFANKIKTPLLMTHGEADNNSGTFPIQSERLYNAIKGHGGTVRFVRFPYESHGYAAKESVLHMLWEMDNWLETYVKNTKANAKASTK